MHSAVTDKISVTGSITLHCKFCDFRHRTIQESRKATSCCSAPSTSVLRIAGVAKRLCAAMARSEVKVTFRVTLQVPSLGLTMFVVGSCPELGLWKARLAKPLQLVGQSHDSEIWVGSYIIEADSVQYRLFLGRVEQTAKTSAAAEELILVHSWESLPDPRQLTAVATGVDDIEITYGRLNGYMCVDRGWLTGQVAIRLSLCDNALNFYCPLLSQGNRYSVKCIPINTRVCKGSMNTLNTNDKYPYLSGSSIASEMFVSVLDDKQASPRLMPREGVLYKPSDFLTFSLETWSIEHLCFKIIVSAAEQNDDGNYSQLKFFKEIGVAFFGPLDQKCSKESITTSILSRDMEIVGQLKVDALIITSLQYECDMSSSISRFQKPDPDRTWFIGHRGMGRTITDGIQNAGLGEKENTILSLKQAVCHGADFVEFDVMLSKDRIPILHHDFVTTVSARGKLDEAEKQVMIPVHNLDLKDLEVLQTSAAAVSEDSCSVIEEDQPFPQLKSCLQKVDPSAGFNVEFKYCMRLRNGELEEGLVHFPGRNDYVDDILYELLLHGGDRKIILSAFDPDVCAMLRAKQNRYPVLFLTQGTTAKYPQYEDSRTWNVETAIQFAVAESLRGICVHAENLLRDPTLIEKGKSQGLWVVCWGDDSNNQENMKTLMENGVDGIILDQINEFLDR